MTHYVYDQGGNVIAEADGGTGASQAEYVWLNGMPLAYVQGGTIYYVHPDHLATPQRITDGTAAIVWDADYRPFGEATVSGALTFNLRFPGQYEDAETGLHYNYFRDYDPATGRYIQSDPIGLQGGWNTYGYAGGNPVMAFDLRGLVEGERGATGGSSGKGTNNPYKHCREHPTDPKLIKCKNHQTGKWVEKKKPADWPVSKLEAPKLCENCVTEPVIVTAATGGLMYIIYVCLGAAEGLASAPFPLFFDPVATCSIFPEQCFGSGYGLDGKI